MFTVEEFYEVIGGNYEDASNRLPSSILKRFIIKFAKDTSFATVEQAIANEDLYAAFKASHNLKGVSANMSFEKLFIASDKLTEFLRPSNYVQVSQSGCEPEYDDIDMDIVNGLFADVKTAYDSVISAIGQFEV